MKKRLTLVPVAVVVFAAGIVLAGSLASASVDRACYQVGTQTGTGTVSSSGTGSTQPQEECVDLTLEKLVEDPAEPGTYREADYSWSAVFVEEPATFRYRIDVTAGSDSGNRAVVPEVSDERCDDAPALDPATDDGDGLLEPGETWSYHCSHAFDPEQDSYRFENTAHASATAELSDGKTVTVPSQYPLWDSAWTQVNALEVTKTVDHSVAEHGTTLSYTIVVHNKSDLWLAGYLVDSGCSNLREDAPPQAASAGYLNLAPGESATFLCEHEFVLGDGDSYTNEACAQAHVQDIKIEQAAQEAQQAGFDCASATTNLVDPTISGLFFEDMNANGVRDPGDPPTQGFKAFLDVNANGALDEGDRQGDSGADGGFSLGVPIGAFKLGEMTPPGWHCSAPAPTCSYDVERAALPVTPPVLLRQARQRPLDAKSYEFGNWREASVAGAVIDDANANGIPESPEGAFAGAQVFADSNGNGSPDTGEPSTTSAATGQYLLAGLRPGTYTVRVVVPSGRRCTAPAGCSHPVTLTSGQGAAGHDFLLAPAAQQAVLGVRRVAGLARLAGRTGCVSNVFRARVTGRRMARVAFRLDGRRIKVVRMREGRVASVRINPLRLKLGRHRLVARVSFAADSGTRVKRLRLTFSRCGRQLVAPQFTG